MSARMHLPSGVVTFLFTDIEGSTRLAQMLGAGYRGMLTEHRRLLRRTLGGSGGSALFSEGDSLFVAFPDARAALTACALAQQALAGHDWPTPQARPLVRMGLHTGLAQPEGGEYATPVVHRAARIAAAAHGGQVLCSAATARRAGQPADGWWLLDLGLHKLRGFDDRERLYQLIAPGLSRHFPRPRTLGEAPHNLPAPIGNFVGRVAERAELTELLHGNRLVSVVGTGGAGKTRLVVETARATAGRYPDGTWFVDVATVSDPDLVSATVAVALGLRPEPGRSIRDTLVEFVAGRRLLLVLDTCDAQPAATAALAACLVNAGPAVTVLASGREPLGLPGELVWRIPPLSPSPGPDGGPGDAVALLLDRAAAARGGRSPGDPEMVPLRKVAERLEGLPLALELAAARLRVLSVAELAARLDDVVSTLDSGLSSVDDKPAERHSTLQAAVTWSYRTLDAEPARLLRWLAVFAGRVDLATVEWLLDGDPLRPLSILVDKSLVQAEIGPGATSYRLPDPIRSYAARKLADSGDEREARNRHAAWVEYTVGRARFGPDGQQVTQSLFAFDRIADELRAALYWSATRGSARQGLRLVSAVDPWWWERGLASEVRTWLYRLGDRPGAVPDRELALAYRCDPSLGERAEQAARRTGDPGLLARVLSGRAGQLTDLGQVEQRCREVLEFAHRHRVVSDALDAVYTLAEVLWRRGELTEASELLAAARPVEQARPELRGGRTVDWLLGLVALRRGDLVAAHDHLTVALRWRLGYGFHASARTAVQAFGVRCALAGDNLTAARLFGAATTGLRPAGGFWSEWQNKVRTALGDAAFDTAYAEGGRLSLSEAATVALAVEHPDLAAGSLRFTDADSHAS